jgi:hypothetical protein
MSFRDLKLKLIYDNSTEDGSAKRWKAPWGNFTRSRAQGKNTGKAGDKFNS